MTAKQTETYTRWFGGKEDHMFDCDGIKVVYYGGRRYEIDLYGQMRSEKLA